MKSYKILTPIKLESGIKSEGSVILNDDDAKELLDVAAIEESNTLGVPVTVEERLAAIKEAIGHLNLDNGDLWSRDGKPTVAAIALVTGWNVTGAERDAAWAEVKPAAPIENPAPAANQTPVAPAAAETPSTPAADSAPAASGDQTNTNSGEATQ